MFDRLGVHVLPKHFYTPVSDYAWLRDNRNAWEPPWDMTGVHWDLDEQLAWLSDLCRDHLHEVAGLSAYRTLAERGLGFGYGPIESQVLHCFLRRVAPRRIIEVGSGVSTACMLAAIDRNRAEGRTKSDIVCVDPYPKSHLTGRGVTYVQALAQTVERSIFDPLEAGDLLFVDSSHAVKTGSDVGVLFLQVLPKLRPGVYVHIHDINLPYLYMRDALNTIFGWQETAMLAALLHGNTRFQVRCALSGLHYGRQSQLRELLPDYRPQTASSGLAATGEDQDHHFPSSIYLQTA